MIPAEIQQELQKEYEIRFSSLQEYRNSIWKILTKEFFQKIIPENSTVLDLGSGWGEFINNIKASKKYAMDLNPEGARRVSSDITFLEQDCSHPWTIPNNSLDFVFTSNFFEHLPNKDALRRTLNNALIALKPGGRLICMGPNIKYLPGSYWDFWDHHVALTETSLEEGLKLVGFDVEKKVGRFLPYTMVGKKPAPHWMVSLYLNLPFVWPFFGKQFLVIGKKP